MELHDFTEPLCVRKGGSETITLTPPNKLKLQITGPGASVILDEVPPDGKTWTVLLRVDIVENDA